MKRDIRHLFDKPVWYQEDEEYVDYDVHDNAPKRDLRLFTLTYDVEKRRFYATLRRSPTSDDDFGIETSVPRRLVDMLVSLLSDKEMARLTAKSLGIED